MQWVWKKTLSMQSIVLFGIMKSSKNKKSKQTNEKQSYRSINRIVLTYHSACVYLDLYQ